MQLARKGVFEFATKWAGHLCLTFSFGPCFSCRAFLIIICFLASWVEVFRAIMIADVVIMLFFVWNIQIHGVGRHWHRLYGGRSTEDSRSCRGSLQARAAVDHQSIVNFPNTFHPPAQRLLRRKNQGLSNMKECVMCNIISNVPCSPTLRLRFWLRPSSKIMLSDGPGAANPARDCRHWGGGACNIAHTLYERLAPFLFFPVCQP